MSDNASYVDPFLGNFETTIDKRPAGTIAAGWQWLKAWPGNTHPGAVLPFGMVSVCAYTGGYPIGYGPYAGNYGGKAPDRVMQTILARGFTHFHHSGTGGIGDYYNYLLVTPFVGDYAGSTHGWELVDEQAAPGRYAVTLGGVRASVTVTARGAIYRITYPAGKPAGLRFDLPFSYRHDPKWPAGEAGVRGMGGTMPPASAVVCAPDGRMLSGTINTPPGVAINFHCTAEAGGAGLRWTHDDGRVVAAEMQPAEGVRLKGIPAGATVELRVAFSLRSVEKAKENHGRELSAASLEVAQKEARGKWNEHLGRVEIDAPTIDARQVFYSALYHSLIKPIDVTGDSPWCADDRPIYLDFCTLWDVAKTQLPLVMLLYPQRAAQILNGLLNVYDLAGTPANAILIQPLEAMKPSDIQGFGLGFPVFAHAAGIGLPGVDWKRVLAVLQRIFPADRRPEGKPGLDFALAAFSIAQVARAAGDDAAARKWTALADHWKDQFSRATGKICKGSFYEGTSWNYSFGVWHDVPAMVEFCGGRDNILADLDAFFCYDGCRVRDVHKAAFPDGVLPDECRFEGLNNEPDMEVPYLYTYLGRHDRLCEVVRTTTRYRYTTGRGGLPGNDDSGGLSSWYGWSALGLYPAFAQGLYFIGSPVFARSELRLDGGRFVIEAPGTSDANIYVRSATLNGQPLHRAFLYPHEVHRGGTLRLEMAATPGDAFTELPPSPAWAAVG